MTGFAKAHPNLALIKYWGKFDSHTNLPATPSIGISLEAFCTETRVKVLPGGDRLSWDVRINGELQEPGRFASFFTALEKLAREKDHEPAHHLLVESSNNFPTAAGLASSASGFAALAGAADKALGLNLSRQELSSLARTGSGSASRSVFPGFVSFPRASSEAFMSFPADHWPELRCLIVQVSNERKPKSSRNAMEQSRLTSPYYQAWLEDSLALYDRALEAIRLRDLNTLGPLLRQSYLRMFSTMFSAAEPVIYWQPSSIRLMQLAAELRSEGVPVYETMDAGPQVKLICSATHSAVIRERVRRESDSWIVYESIIGGGLETREE